MRAPPAKVAGQVRRRSIPRDCGRPNNPDTAMSSVARPEENPKLVREPTLGSPAGALSRAAQNGTRRGDQDARACARAPRRRA